MRRRCYDLHARDLCLTLGHATQIMGIVNVTPDSFSQDGQMRLKGRADTATCLRYALKLIRDGADILDIGGESTRPGAVPVSVDQEAKRVIPLITALARKTKIPISIDTYKPQVARQALDAGASIVNNIMGTKVNVPLLKMVRDYKAAIVLMHMRGNPATMQSKAKYSDLMGEIIEELRISVEKCLEIGIKKDRIIIDPGIGFAKTVEQNLTLLRQLPKLAVLHCPMLLGVSRKSFIGAVLNQEVGRRLMGTAATVAVGIMQGAHIVRVHDVAAMKETASMTDALINR